MSSRPAAFTTSYEVTRPTPYVHLSALNPEGEPNDDGILQIGAIVWTSRILPHMEGHRTALGFIDAAGEILLDACFLKHRDGHANGSPHS